MNQNPQLIDDTIQEGVVAEAMTPEVDEGAARQEEELAASRLSAMDAIGLTLSGHLNEAIQFRARFEAEWDADIRQYETGDSESAERTETKQYSSTEDYKSATDNITRPAVLTYASRLGDMLFPTSDRNWDIDTTPKPDLPPDVVAELQQRAAEQKLPEDQFDGLVMEIARKRMGGMRTKITDQLAEARYNAKGRQVILDACKMGFGVMRGPFAKARKRRHFVAGQGFKAMVVEDNYSPEIERCDPWNVYPMPCRRIDDCPGVFELHEMSAKRLSELRNQPGFSSEQVDRALRQPPSWSPFASSGGSSRRMIDSSTIRQNSVYPVISYDGEMPKEALVIFLDQLMSEQKIDGAQRSEILREVDESNALHVNCNVWMTGSIVMKVAISPIDHCSQMYKFFTFEDREDGPFGRSVSNLLRDPQRNVRMLWAAILLNSIMSSGVQIAVKKGALVPLGPAGQQVDYRFTYPRVWGFGDDIEDVNKAMQVFQIPNVVGSLMPVYERAKLNGSEQVMLPQIAEGQPTAAVPTSSGLAMLMNAANIVQRRIAMKWDDEITTNVITDYYEWNMRYGEDSIKGDYKVIARASSHLLVKDIQAQHFLTALQLFQSNPLLQPRMKEKAWADELLRIMDLDSTNFILSEEEYEAKAAEQAQNQQPDAETLRAQAAAKVADARVMAAEADAEFKQGRLQLLNAEGERRFESGIADRESRERIAAANVQAAMAGLTKDEQLRVMQMANDMQKAIQSESEETRREGMRIAAKAQDKAIEMQRDQFEAQVERNTAPGPRLA